MSQFGLSAPAKLYFTPLSLISALTHLLRQFESSETSDVNTKLTNTHHAFNSGVLKDAT